MANGWTSERRARQAIMIKQWKPWLESTGPKSDDGKSVVSRNAYKGGFRRQLRDMQKKVNRVLREQCQMLDEIHVAGLSIHN